MKTSLDVTFTVEVRRWGFQQRTGAGDDEALMRLGVAGSLDAAMRRATSDMARWLEASHGLSATEAALVMGFALHFDVPDVVPPGFDSVARLPKAAIPARPPAAPPAR